MIQAFDARELLASAHNDAMRIGTFGILTTGFVISVLLTVASLAAYALISFRRQLPEFGILRAMGIARRQVVALIVFEHGFLVVLGTAARHRIGDPHGRAVHSLHAARCGAPGQDAAFRGDYGVG